jgi:putative transposase
VRRECLDHLLIGGRRHLLGILGSYTRHYHRHRPHRSLDLSAPERSERSREAEPLVAEPLRRRDVLDGLIHGYDHAA